MSPVEYNRQLARALAVSRHLVSVLRGSPEVKKDKLLLRSPAIGRAIEAAERELDKLNETIIEIERNDR